MLNKAKSSGCKANRIFPAERGGITRMGRASQTLRCLSHFSVKLMFQTEYTGVKPKLIINTYNDRESCCAQRLLLDTWLNPSIFSHFFNHLIEDFLCTFGASFCHSLNILFLNEKRKCNAKRNVDGRAGLVVLRSTAKAFFLPSKSTSSSSSSPWWLLKCVCQNDGKWGNQWEDGTRLL